MSQLRPRIVRGTPRNLARLGRRLRAGELVAVPTETVYGLAADAFNPAACRRIFQVKGRPSGDPLIVHLASARDLGEVAVPNAAALRLARAFWPGPLTLVLPKTAAVPGVVTSGLPSVAVRVPAHPLLRRLIRIAGRPLAAPSANPFGYVSPTTAEHVRRDLGSRIRHILDGGPARIGLESTIVDLRDPRRPRLLRPGGVARADVERILKRRLAAARPAARRGAQVAPGQLTRHYSPRTPVVLHARLHVRGPSDEAWLFLAKPQRTAKARRNVFWLSKDGNLRSAAKTLFATLRQLDTRAFRKIHVELAKSGHLAEAINDRLRRAAARG